MTKYYQDFPLSKKMDVQDQSIAELCNLILRCHLPAVREGEERPIEVNDFLQYIEESVIILKKIKTDIQAISDIGSFVKLHGKDFLVALFILLGENHAKFLWNCEESLKLIEDIRCIVKETFCNATEEDILVNGVSIAKTCIRPLLRPILLELRPKLLKSTWKQHPASVQCYVWLINTISFPHLNDFVKEVLPTALILTDDFINENRVIGVKCLARVIDNITIAELKFYGYGQLIYKALERQLREKDAELARIAIPCIFTLVAKLEMDFGDIGESHKWSRFDDVLEIVLEVIEMEHLVAMRKIYVSQMKYIIETVGVRIIRWSKRVLRVLDHYLDVSGRHMDLSSAVHSLKALEAFLKISESCGKHSLNEVTFIIFRLLYNIAALDSTELKEAVALCGQCLRLIMEQCSPEAKEELVNSVESDLMAVESTRTLGKLIKSLLS